jgi:Rrf2 family iron-sulfur cluster assembly transcriptional regulator
MLTTKARYAVMAVIDMAYSYDNQKPITLADISVRQKIALSYLEQIFNKLRKAGIVRAIKGPGGGYLLTEANFEIAKVIEAVEENIEMTRCSNRTSAGCMPDNTKCSTHDLWEGLNQQIRSYFNNVTIEDVTSGRLKNKINALNIETLSGV